MQKERRNRKRIKADMMRSYYIMESKVDAKAREIFKRMLKIKNFKKAIDFY